MNQRKLRKLLRDSLPLTGRRIMLREIEIDDAYDMYEYASVPEVSRYLLWEPHINLTATEGYIEFLSGRYKKGLYADWALILLESGKMIGTCGYASLDFDEKCCEIGYVLSPYYRKKGYMTEAVATILDFSFNVLQLKIAKLRIIRENEDSIKLAEHFGFEKRGEVVMEIKDEEKTVFLYQLTADKYLDIKK